MYKRYTDSIIALVAILISSLIVFGQSTGQSGASKNDLSGVWPFSDAMRLEERWRRVNNNTLELIVKVDDPKTYTRPWVSGKIT